MVFYPPTLAYPSRREGEDAGVGIGRYYYTFSGVAA